jgi:predicted transcriptional regulator
MAQKVELNEQTVNVLLQNLVNKGIKEARIFQITERAALHKVFMFLSKLEENADLTITSAYQKVFNVLNNVFHVFTMEESATITTIVDWINQNLIPAPVTEATAEAPDTTQKITEL